jgi:hypothetical protein
VLDLPAPAESSLLVRNTEAVPVTLERVTTSCPCVRVAMAPLELRSNEARSLSLTVDPTDDPGFEGGLSVQMTGYLSDGGIGFQTKVNFEAQLEGGHGEGYGPMALHLTCVPERSPGRSSEGCQQ